MDIPYETYHEGAKLIEFWLKPAVVALGVFFGVFLIAVTTASSPLSCDTSFSIRSLSNDR